MKERGELETYSKGQVFHSQDFGDVMFMLKRGYVKRYQVTKGDARVIELIYGPDHIFPLSQLYKRIFGIEQNQENLVYVYQAMTDIEIWRMNDDDLMDEIEKDPKLYVDLYYESGLRLKSNIDRLASNALKDEYKKVAHQLVCLAEEFGRALEVSGKPAIKIGVPLEPVDMAEQLNISVEVADAVLISLVKSSLIKIKGDMITVTDLDMLKDIYL
jgi:CRP-like cAMP-binding protein